MAAGDLITDDWQIEWGGLLLGPQPYGITGVQGLADLPSVISADRDRLRAHGQIAGDDFLSGRSVEVGFRVEGTSNEDTFVQAAALADVMIPGEAEAPLVFQIPGIADGVKAQISARVRARSLPVDMAYRVGVVGGRALFFATDPRIYSAEQTVQSVSLPSGGGGLDVPVEVPAALVAASESGTLELVNEGNFRAPWSFRIDGPALNPQVVNAGEGYFLGFNIELAEDEFLRVTTGPDQRQVVLNDQESRYYTIQAGSTWWDLRPGTTETLFRAATLSAALLTTTSRSAWIT